MMQHLVSINHQREFLICEKLDLNELHIYRPHDYKHIFFQIVFILLFELKLKASIPYSSCAFIILLQIILQIPILSPQIYHLSIYISRYIRLIYCVKHSFGQIVFLIDNFECRQNQVRNGIHFFAQNNLGIAKQDLDLNPNRHKRICGSEKIGPDPQHWF